MTAPTNSDDVARVAGIPVLCATSVASAARFLVRANVRGFVCSLNAEVMARYLKDSTFRSIVAGSAYGLADGASVAWAANRAGGHTVPIPGVELWLALVRESQARRQPRVALIGATTEVLHKTCVRLRGEEECEPVLAFNGFEEAENPGEIAVQLANARPDYVFVAMGVPRQEHMIDELSRRYPDALYLNLGGSLDIYAGLKRRAPLWMRKCSLEWLYRVCQQPSRIIRLLASWRWIFHLVMGRY